MKRRSTAVLFIAVVSAWAATRVCDIEPHANTHAWSEQGSNGMISQTFTATTPELLWAEFFVGSLSSDGDYEFAIVNSKGQLSYEGRTAVLAARPYSYVQVGFAQAGPLLTRGELCTLRITHSSDDSVDFYYRTGNPYQYGQLTNPSQGSGADLCCRIEGVSYNQPGLLGTWDLLPPGYLHGWAPLEVFEQGFDNMKALGFRSTRLADCWYIVQSDSSRPDSFDWDRTDEFWELMAGESIQAHLVAGPPTPDWRIIGEAPYPAGLFGPIDSTNRTFAYYLHYARRYGPGGSFWAERGDLPYLPLRYVECLNEPVYQAASNWWLSDNSLRDPVVQLLRDTSSSRNAAYAALYTRYCQVVDAALKSATDSANPARAQIYCPNDVSGEPFTAHDWLAALSQRGIAEYCDMVTYHCHIDPGDSAGGTADLIEREMRDNGLGDKGLANTEGGIAWRCDEGHNAELEQTRQARNLVSAYVTLWARNSRPVKPVAWFDFQGSSTQFIHDSLDGSLDFWSLTDDDFELRPAGYAMRQMAEKLAGRQFNRQLGKADGIDTGMTVYEFQGTGTGDSSRVWIAWKNDRDGDSTGEVRIPARTADIDQIGMALGSVNPVYTPPVAADGYLTVTVGKSPVYFAEPRSEPHTRANLVLDSVRTIPAAIHAGEPVLLRAFVRNAGSFATPNPDSSPFIARFYSSGILIDSVLTRRSLDSNETASVSAAWIPYARDTLLLSVEVNPGVFVETDFDNNRGYLLRNVAAGDSWQPLPGIPVSSDQRGGGSGASLACDPARPGIYALKGNGTNEFMVYDLDSAHWDTLPVVPVSGRSRTVRKGGSMTQLQGRIYATKGGNSMEFWCYDPESTDTGTWLLKADIPAGGRRVKDASGMVGLVRADTGFVCFLKGSGTREFYRYNAIDNAWQELAPAPAGISGKAFKTGSALALSEDGKFVYALKGKYNELYRYSLDSNTWSTQTSLPLVGIGGRKKKAGAGASMAFMNGRLYALKGGNTREFWGYSPTDNAWLQHKDVPLGNYQKSVNAGGALVAARDAVFALKGNHTLEFYTCDPGGGGTEPGTYQPGQPGSNEVQVLTRDDVRTPVWRPTGEEIAFTAPDEQNNVNLYRTTPDGDSAVALAELGLDCSEPVYSPDGNQIAFLLDDSTSHATQLAVVPASGGTPMVLTNSPVDKGRPAWNPDGSLLVYAREDTETGYEQVFARSPTTTGSEFQLTTCSHDHDCPVFRTATEIIALAEDDDGWNQVVSLTVDAADSSLTEVFLTSSSRDHEAVVVADGIVFCELVDEDGFSRIARVDSTEAGGEVLLSPANCDCFGLSASPDGKTLHCLKQTASGTQLGRIDPVSGGFVAITDDAVERGVPDVGADNALCVYSSSFARDEGLFRSTGDAMVFEPRAELVINPIDTTAGDTIPNRDGSGHVPCCVPLVVLKAVACDSSHGWADSMRVTQDFCAVAETISAMSDWLGYESLSVRYLDHGEGKYRITMRFLIKQDSTYRDTSIVRSDSCLMDLTRPAGSVVINSGAVLTNSSVCTLALTGSDADSEHATSGIHQMRLANFPPAGPVRNAGFAGDTHWVGNHYLVHDSLGMVELPMVADSDLYFYQQLTTDSGLAFAPGRELRVSADVVTEQLTVPVTLAVNCGYVKWDSSETGADTVWVTVVAESLPLGTAARVGASRLCHDFTWEPGELTGYWPVLARVGCYCAEPESGAGRVWLDNVRLDIVGGEMFENSDWQAWTDTCFWLLNPKPGLQPVFLELRDRAGNVSEESGPDAAGMVSDTIRLDNASPEVDIHFPDQGRVMNDTLVEIAGLVCELRIESDSGRFHYYRLTWSGTEENDTSFGISPESLFYQPRAPAWDPSVAGGPPMYPSQHLAWWNTKGITDQYGPGFYHLTLTARDSAGNETEYTRLVYLTDSTDLPPDHNQHRQQCRQPDQCRWRHAVSRNRDRDRAALHRPRFSLGPDAGRLDRYPGDCCHQPGYDRKPLDCRYPGYERPELHQSGSPARYTRRPGRLHRAGQHPEPAQR